MLSNRRNHGSRMSCRAVSSGRILAKSAVFGVRTSTIAPTTKATLFTTVLRSFGNAVFSPRPTSSANRRTVPILSHLASRFSQRRSLA
ncbi:hypothetical protein BN874_1840010 [Candidatus Contendobacter odensis Run_B_J11]|uniref:Uncharacterized protein n=1 Tax=Candidatus Contendobacter odensis Run_B_J11 TaxID=1400861 RepID=A0A7U7J2Z0_9GAMM|nr:hypothetical protein BN874_1840010 [Candidatus Contendobacter odensis Run_B_J11]